MGATVDQSEENEEHEDQRKVRARQFCSVSEHAFNFLPFTHTHTQAEQELAQRELEERVHEQHQREKQLQEEIERLRSEITKVTNHVMFSQNRKTLPTTSPLLLPLHTPLQQESRLQENANSVKSLQKQVEELQAKATESPPSSPSRRRRGPLWVCVVDAISDQ